MGRSLGMHTLNSNLAELVKSGQISKESALEYCSDKAEMNQLIAGVR
jgi:Tfp pilus assembly pilus retraction ATPase PilT